MLRISELPRNLPLDISWGIAHVRAPPFDTAVVPPMSGLGLTIHTFTTVFCLAERAQPTAAHDTPPTCVAFAAPCKRYDVSKAYIQ